MKSQYANKIGNRWTVWIRIVYLTITKRQNIFRVTGVAHGEAKKSEIYKNMAEYPICNIYNSRNMYVKLAHNFQENDMT